ncbi:CobW family GTP-binding protein [Paenibacillus caui]|uniref:CobW family GTP-binding protein n=1 Tax=Paenibacillus caui TaxID=2873927 RepID=UPI001F21645B|nr:GTP-binding protein [Paenibacillus caui]
MLNAEEKAIPVYILSGFLGSGKTTLLGRMLNYWKNRGARPAVIMNELGEINLEGLLIRQEVPMAEMLGGCICCSIRGDLSTQLANLITNEHPDVIVIEATGAANPLEILDSVTEAALYMKLDIKPVITVVDSPYLLELLKSQQGKTFRLMQEQIRCASILIMNKVDRLEGGKVEELVQLLERSNPYALKIPAVKCDVSLEVILSAEGADAVPGPAGEDQQGHHGRDGQNHEHEHDHEHEHGHCHGHNHDHDHGPHCSCNHEHSGHMHDSHEHVMAYTHYLQAPVDSVQFEQLIAELPRDVYRAKGILTFSDTRSRYLFQYAFRQPDFMKITPQGEVPDVVVFIGEHFDKQALKEKLRVLETRRSGAL